MNDSKRKQENGIKGEEFWQYFRYIFGPHCSPMNEIQIFFWFDNFSLERERESVHLVRVICNKGIQPERDCNTCSAQFQYNSMYLIG